MNNDVLAIPADVIAIAQAIALAEGFYVAGSLPQRKNNPGDIENQLGQKIVFDTVLDGWNALYRQVELMISGRSRIYKPSMTWIEIGQFYDGEQAFMNWVENVTTYLKVSVGSTLQSFVDNYKVTPGVARIELEIKDHIQLGDSIKS